jgi:hypothetical protein
MPGDGKATSKNLESCRKSIDIQQLLKTLRDAIHFTDSLGVPFLSVDAYLNSKVTKLSERILDDEPDLPEVPCHGGCWFFKSLQMGVSQSVLL